jgi:hypothetical protein
MYPKTLIKQALFLLSSIIIFQSCHRQAAPGTYANEQIPASEASNFHDLNKMLFDGLKVNDKKQLLNIFSKEMIDNTSNLKDIEVISNHMHDGEFTVQEEYYVVSTKRGKDTIRVTNKGVNNHKIGYTIDAPETYMAFFSQKSIANGQLVSVTYQKLDYGWKVTDLEIEPYTMNGKTAPELYEFAKDEYAKHYLFDAANVMGEARSCVQPSLNWLYPDNKAMEEFYGKVLGDANHQFGFPYAVGSVSTMPKIISVQTFKNNEGVFPQIYYQSQIKLSNTAGLLKENLQVRKALSKLMPGIDKDKKYVFYAVFNKMPSAYESVDRYEVTDTIK